MCGMTRANISHCIISGQWSTLENSGSQDGSREPHKRSKDDGGSTGWEKPEQKLFFPAPQNSVHFFSRIFAFLLTIDKFKKYKDYLNETKKKGHSLFDLLTTHICN